MMHLEQATVLLKEIVVQYRCGAVLYAPNSQSCQIQMDTIRVDPEIVTEIRTMCMKRGLKVYEGRARKQLRIG